MAGGVFIGIYAFGGVVLESVFGWGAFWRRIRLAIKLIR